MTRFYHGLSDTKEFEIYKSMLNRCKRKIKYYENCEVCEEWKGREGFLNFLAFMGLCPEGKSLDRKDGTKGYSPENCKWSTPLEQVLNTKKKKSLTGIRGVFFDKRYGTYEAKIKLNGKYKYLGRTNDKEAARELYLAEYYKTYSKFPPEYKPI